MTRVLASARFGRAGTKVHLADADYDGRYYTLLTSIPLCGSYTRPGTGWIFPNMEVTCTKCLEMHKLMAPLKELARCPHCNARRFDNPAADPALVAGMGHKCWKCLEPLPKDEVDK